MKVELVTRTEGIGKYDTLTIEEITAAIARHGIIKEDNGKLIKHLMTNKHWSPLDMVNFGFEIETSRAIGRQLLRHWTIKPQEHSQRYSDRVKFEPIELRREHPTNRQSSTDYIGSINQSSRYIATNGNLNTEENEYLYSLLHHLEESERIYNLGIALGVAKECARMILPECTTTTMTMNGSLRSWLMFLNVRCDHHSQKEAVEIATLIGELLEKEMPNLFKEIEWRKGMFV